MPQTGQPSTSPNDAPVPVIFIAGWGHSGSTLLARLISGSPAVVGVGEVIFFNYLLSGEGHERVAGGAECTCGQPLATCPFWRPVVQRATEPGRPTPSIPWDTSHSARLRWLWRLWRWRVSGKAPRDTLGDDARLLRAVLAEAGPDVRLICDESKDFARLIRLAMNPQVEVYPLMLVRDGRGVAHSYEKSRERMGSPPMSIWRAAVLWIAVNLLTALAIRLAGKPMIRVSYNRFCEDPAATLSRLNAELDLGIHTDRYLAEANASEHHFVGGNILRFKPIESIRRDESWREHITGWRRALLSVMVAPFNALWVARSRFAGR